MKISEVEAIDPAKKAADNLKQSAKRMTQQASAAEARVRIWKAQQQLAKATKPSGVT